MSTSNYKLLFKATGLFGMVEALRIFLRIGVNKFASTYLGLAGYGIVGLIENITQLISSLTSFGIQFTGVRAIAAQKNSDEVSLHKTIKFVTLFTIASGTLAAFISVVFAQQISKYAFKTTDYTIWFVILGVYFVCNSYVQGKTIILEGLQEVRKLLLLNVFVNIFGALVIVVCYYYFYLNGIVVAMVVTSALNAFIFWRGTQPYQLIKVTLNKEELQTNLKYFSKSGGLLAINTTIGLACFFLIRMFFKPIDNGHVLGYYHTGNTLMVAYVGIVFIAISKFYFPRLSQTLQQKQKEDGSLLVNNQLELCLLTLMPVLFLLYLIGKSCIELLFSTAFLPVYEILVFGLAAIFIKGINYVVGYMILSHNHIKTYFYINALSDVLNVVLTIAFYRWIGLYGIGLAILVNYSLSALYTLYYVKKSYDFKMNKQVKNLFMGLTFANIVVITAYFKTESLWFYVITFCVFMIALIYSAVKLDTYLFDGKTSKKIRSFFKK